MLIEDGISVVLIVGVAGKKVGVSDISVATYIVDVIGDVIRVTVEV
jgi:hypothetical protein